MTTDRKTTDQIKNRIAELQSMLSKETKALRDNPTREPAKMYRLQGNIGALEWVLREDA